MNRPFEKDPGSKIQMCLSVLSFVPRLYTDTDTHIDPCRHIHTHMHVHTYIIHFMDPKLKSLTLGCGVSLNTAMSVLVL